MIEVEFCNIEQVAIPLSILSHNVEDVNRYNKEPSSSSFCLRSPKECSMFMLLLVFKDRKAIELAQNGAYSQFVLAFSTYLHVSICTIVHAPTILDQKVRLVSF
jgi:hypothetical protein